MSKNKTADAADHAAKRLARLAAVQALYQMALTQKPAAEVIKNFQDHPPALSDDAGEAPALPDAELFSAIVTGVEQHAAALDEMIAASVDAKLSAERLEILLRAILRAGAFELHHHGPIPAGVIINDYVDVTHAFFGAREPGLVNAILDKLAKKLRS